MWKAGQSSGSSTKWMLDIWNKLPEVVAEAGAISFYKHLDSTWIGMGGGGERRMAKCRNMQLDG